MIEKDKTDLEGENNYGACIQEESDEAAQEDSGETAQEETDTAQEEIPCLATQEQVPSEVTQEETLPCFSTADKKDIFFKQSSSKELN